jgi:alcohol dehydrogenase class IV
MNHNSFKKPTIKFHMPTRWHHGRGMASKTGEMLSELGCKKPLLLTDKFLLSAAIVDPVIDSLDRKNITYTICDDVNREPTVKLFETITGKMDLQSFDAIIAVGGGSVLDVSKGLSIIGSFKGHIRDYDGFDLVPEVPDIKVVAVPTTSGTGSEVSDGVALIDESRDTKFLVISKKICPAIAITDPEMTVRMPPSVTASSGMDALVHAIESYISLGANPATDLFAKKAIGLISRGLKSAYISGEDMDARERMQIGATMAMIAAMNSYLGLCHAMAMPLCALYNIPHGQVCGMLLPHVLKFNSISIKEREEEIFKIMGFSHDYSDLIKLLDDINLAAGLNDFGYKEEHMDTIINETLASAQAPTNPRLPSRNDIADIVEKII